MQRSKPRPPLAQDVGYSVRDYAGIREVCERRFPAVFTPRGTLPVPLKIGIYEEILAALEGEVGRRRLRGFMAAWCSRWEYKEALAQASGQPRYDLHGAVDGEVMPAQAATAHDQCVAIKARLGLPEESDGSPPN